MTRSLLAPLAALLSVTSCAVNPDADKALRDERRRADSIAAAERGVMQPAPDTGQHDMPVLQPAAPVGSEMPVVNPADTSMHKPL